MLGSPLADVETYECQIWVEAYHRRLLNDEICRAIYSRAERNKHTTSYISKKAEESGNSLVSRAGSCSYSCLKNRLHCGKGVCEQIQLKAPNGSGILLDVFRKVDDGVRRLVEEC